MRLRTVLRMSRLHTALPPVSISAVAQSTVKVFTQYAPPNFILPWQRKQQLQASGTAYIVDPARGWLITNAHVVMHATLVEVRRHQREPIKFRARVCVLSAECDLALLTVDDAAFWETSQPPTTTVMLGAPAGATLEEAVAAIGALGGLPRLQQVACVVGYPLGGDQISVTSGVISRIDFVRYSTTGDRDLLAIQLDAAVNSGNSGGPALVEDEGVEGGLALAGIAFQSLGGAAENIGYIIPLPIVAAFLRFAIAQLQSVEQTREPDSCLFHDGFGTFGIVWQQLHNESLRKYVLGNAGGGNGILVQELVPLSSAKPQLQPGDALLSVGNTPIGGDGTVGCGDSMRLPFVHFIKMSPVGESIDVVVKKRASTSLADATTVSLSTAIEIPLVPRHLCLSVFNGRPSYVLFGGVVMTQLTFGFLAEWGEEWLNAAPRWLTTHVFGLPTCTHVDMLTDGLNREVRAEVVVISQLLPHPINRGYDVPFAEVNAVSFDESSDRVMVRGLEHLRTLLGHAVRSKRQFVVLHLKFHDFSRMAMVLPVDGAVQADAVLTSEYGIPNQPW